MTRFITVTVHYISYDVKCAQSGNFPVNPVEFKKNPDQEASKVAVDFIEKYIDRPYTITKVTYNQENDITELVKKFQL